MSQVYYNHTNKLDAVRLGIAPAATIALRREGNSFVYGVTVCSKYDNFSRKYGREVALGRLNKNFRTTQIPEELLKEEAEIGEKGMCLAFLYLLANAVTINSRKWKKKITKFNKAQETPVIPISTNSTATSRNWNTDERA